MPTPVIGKKKRGIIDPVTGNVVGGGTSVLETLSSGSHKTYAEQEAEKAAAHSTTQLSVPNNPYIPNSISDLVSGGAESLITDAQAAEDKLFAEQDTAAEDERERVAAAGAGTEDQTSTAHTSLAGQEKIRLAAEMAEVTADNARETEYENKMAAGADTEDQTKLGLLNYPDAPTDPTVYKGVNIDEYLDKDINAPLTDVEKRYKAILEGNDPVSEQNMRRGITGLDRMGANVEAQTARQAAEMGIPAGSEMYNQLLEKNRQTLMSGGSGVLSNIATQNLQNQQNVLSKMSELGKFKANFGVTVGKFSESVNRYGYEATMDKMKDKRKMRQYIMDNPDAFGESVQDATRRDYFKEMGIDYDNLPTNPTDAENAKQTLTEWLTTAHPEWTAAQIETEALKRLTQMSPYTNELYGKAYEEAVGAGADVTDTDGDGTGFPDTGAGDDGTPEFPDPLKLITDPMINPIGAPTIPPTGSGPFDPTNPGDPTGWPNPSGYPGDVGRPGTPGGYGNNFILN